MPSPARLVAHRARALPDPGRPRVVTIDGRSGAGKTTLGEQVAALLDDAPVVHLDDLYAGWDGGAHGAHLLAQRILRPLARGERAAYRPYDWIERPYRDDERVVPAAAFVVVEGCFSSIPPARAYADLTVWLEAPADVRRARALSRDGATFAPHWDRWAAQEDLLFAGLPPADLVLRSPSAAGPRPPGRLGAMSDVQVTKNEDRRQYEGRVDGELAGIATYREESGVLVLPHTKVDPRFEGRGVGSAIVRFALDEARDRGMAVDPQCPFVASWIDKHPDYAPLVDA